MVGRRPSTLHHPAQQHSCEGRCYSEDMTDYVERRGEDYMLLGSRVSLASVVTAWKDGLSPETIRDNFPTLRLEQVYGAIAFYLANQAEIDSYLLALAVDFESDLVDWTSSCFGSEQADKRKIEMSI